MKRVVTMIAAVIVGAGCAHSTGAEADRQAPNAWAYYPLEVGNRWSYAVVMLGERTTLDVAVEALRGRFFVDSTGAELAHDAYGVRDRKRYLLRDPVRVGTTWSNVVSVSSAEHYLYRDVGVPCRSPAGSFADCLVVVGRNRIDGQTTMFNEMTYARGVGLVHSRVWVEKSGRELQQSELSLSSYTLVPKTDTGTPRPTPIR